jgi:hypothetical protein
MTPSSLSSASGKKERALRTRLVRQLRNFPVGESITSAVISGWRIARSRPSNDPSESPTHASGGRCRARAALKAASASATQVSSVHSFKSSIRACAESAGTTACHPRCSKCCCSSPTSRGVPVSPWMRMTVPEDGMFIGTHSRSIYRNPLVPANTKFFLLARRTRAYLKNVPLTLSSVNSVFSEVKAGLFYHGAHGAHGAHGDRNQRLFIGHTLDIALLIFLGLS